jgi:hypothetical protein
MLLLLLQPWCDPLVLKSPLLYLQLGEVIDLPEYQDCEWHTSAHIIIGLRMVAGVPAYSCWSCKCQRADLYCREVPPKQQSFCFRPQTAVLIWLGQLFGCHQPQRCPCPSPSRWLGSPGSCAGAWQRYSALLAASISIKQQGRGSQITVGSLCKEP